MNRMNRMQNSAFSLVELSIVLVILGLLTGGILTGQSLIRAAELRSVTTEFNQWRTAVNTFQGKYFALPGDMPNAHQFWGVAGGSGVIGDGCETATGTTTQTCSGDGDGSIEDNDDDEYGENFTFWQHLSNAGMLTGTYNGRAGTGSSRDSAGGVNVPVSNMNNGLWYMEDRGDSSGSAQEFNGSYGNTLLLGGFDNGDEPDEDLITPQEMWNIDKKIDDGMPALGKVVAGERRFCAVQTDGTDLTTAGADAAILDAVYKLDNEDVDCLILFRELF
jgi:prepilin-type N-terminal cleavage/methylation domain-containing protein